MENETSQSEVKVGGVALPLKAAAAAAAASPVAVHKDALEDRVHHVLDLVLVLLELWGTEERGAALRVARERGSVGAEWGGGLHGGPHLLPLLQQQLQLLVGPLARDLVPLGLVLPLGVVLVDAQVQGHVHQRRHQLHGCVATEAKAAKKCLYSSLD